MNGITLRYLDGGDAAKVPVVLLHGLNGLAHAWDDVGASLLKNFRVVALDLRGHGDSDKPFGTYRLEDYVSDVLGVVDQLGLCQPVLVGHALGGRIAFGYAVSHPEMCRGVVSVDIGFSLPPGQKKNLGERMASFPDEFTDLNDAVTRFQRYYPDYPPSMISHMVLWGTEYTPTGWVWKNRRRGLIETVRCWNQSQDLLRSRVVETSVLLVRGGRSPMVTQQDLQDFQAVFSKLSVVELKSAGHYVPFEHPAAFLGVLDGFLASFKPSRLVDEGSRSS